MSWQINPATGDYIMTNGAPVDDPSLIYPAYYRLKIKRTQWLYAPDTSYGSDFYLYQKRFVVNDIEQLTNIADVALQPIIDDGRATAVDCTYLASAGRNDVQLSTTITPTTGTPQTLNLPQFDGTS